MEKERSVPDFAIFQNSRTRESAIWVKEVGKWTEARQSEYDALKALSEIIRHSPHATEIMEQLVEQAHKIGEEELSDESSLPPIPGFFVPPEELDGLDDETPESEK